MERGKGRRGKVDSDARLEQGHQLAKAGPVARRYAAGEFSKRLLRTRMTFSQSLVSVSVSKLDHTCLISVDLGIKTNKFASVTTVVVCHILSLWRLASSANSASVCRSRKFSGISISSGSAATRLRLWWNPEWLFYCKYPGECEGERILKIGQCLVKLLWQKRGGVLFWFTVCSINQVNDIINAQHKEERAHYTALNYTIRDIILFTLNVRPESLTLIPASSDRFLALYVMYLGSSAIIDSLWHISANSIVSSSLIATPHTQDTPLLHWVHAQCFTCT